MLRQKSVWTLYHAITDFVFFILLEGPSISDVEKLYRRSYGKWSVFLARVVKTKQSQL